MFYWPIELKSQDKYLSPKGPNFGLARERVIDVDGFQVSFRCNQHRSRTAVEVVHPNKQYNVADLNFNYFGDKENRWGSISVLSYTWDFYGPWFTGRLGAIKFSVLLLTPAKISETLNFFNPKAFEGGVADYLTYFYGRKLSFDGVQQWLAPQHWIPVERFGCLAVQFDAEVNKQKLDDGLDRCLMLPVGKHHILLLELSISRNLVLSGSKPEPSIDDWIDPKPFTTLANQVLDSVQIKLSPEAEAAQQETLQGLSEADRQLVKDFPPLKWTKEKSDLI